jgi:Transcriptional regulators
MSCIQCIHWITDPTTVNLFSATPQTVSTIVANLERAGAIVRQPHHYHGRIQQIDLSEIGKSLLATCRERVQGIERHLADGLSREEESALRKWLVRVATSAPRQLSIPLAHCQSADWGSKPKPAEFLDCIIIIMLRLDR